MITSLKLKGFQSHLDTKLEFSSGVNILIGPSRNGKTAALRALNWIAKNRPIGIDSFVTHGQKEISATLELDGHTIVRKKNGGENVYILDGEKFAGIGTDVPRPVVELLNLSDLNMAEQFDQPFLLFDSPGQVARVLNSVVHLESIDRALAEVASRKRANDQDVRAQEGRLAELEALLATFPDLEAAEEFIASLEGLENRRREANAKAAALRAYGGELAEL